MALPPSVLDALDLAPPAERLARVTGYLAMSYLYKRSNRLWPVLIQRRLVAKAWRPLVELTRRRHLRFRASLESRETTALPPGTPPVVVSAGV